MVVDEADLREEATGGGRCGSWVVTCCFDEETVVAGVAEGGGRWETSFVGWTRASMVLFMAESAIFKMIAFGRTQRTCSASVGTPFNVLPSTFHPLPRCSLY